jgi:hypothetical protein
MAAVVAEKNRTGLEICFLFADATSWGREKDLGTGEQNVWRGRRGWKRLARILKKA